MMFPNTGLRQKGYGFARIEIRFETGVLGKESGAVYRCDDLAAREEQHE